MNKDTPVSRLNATEETYIQTIASLLKTQQYVKVTDIAKALNVMPSSVSEMLKKLFSSGFIVHIPYGPVTLTQKGFELADYLQLQRMSIQRFFELLGLDPKIAKSDACKMEHILNEATLNRLSQYVEFLENTYHSVDCISCFMKHLKSNQPS